MLERVRVAIEDERARVRAAFWPFVGRPVCDLLTPALVVDLALLRANLGRMAAALVAGPVTLRPHVKTHRSLEIARLQVAAGARGISAATAWEAIVMAAGGLDDLFIVNTFAPGRKLGLVADLARERRVLVASDDVRGAEALSAAAVRAGSGLGILVEVDTGMHRCGTRTPAAAAEVAVAVGRLPGLRLEGITGYEGHCSMENDVQRRATLQRAAMETLLAARDAIQAAGLPCPIVSAGGTRTWWMTAATPGVTEIQAGTYALMDGFHAGIAGGFEPALQVVTTVISTPPGRAIVDAGSKSVADPNLARVVGWDLPVLRFDEEHGILAAVGPRPAVGDIVTLVPGYTPATVAMHDVLHVVEEGVVVDLWPVLPRGPSDPSLMVALGNA